MGTKSPTVMVDSGATHNFISTTMLDILKATAPDEVHWRHTSEPLRVSLADRTVVLSTKLATIKVTLDNGTVQPIDFRVVPCLNHPLILRLQWLHDHNPRINWSAMIVTLGDSTMPLQLSHCKHADRATLCTAE